MKTLKKISILILAIAAITLYSCEKEEIQYNDESQKVEEKKIPIHMLNTQCDILGLASPKVNTTAYYTYISDLKNTSINWTVISGDITIISGQNTNKVYLKFGSNFNGGIIKAKGANKLEECSDIKEFAKATIQRPCPEPVIEDRLCVSGGHPHWRFNVAGIDSRDKITWSVRSGIIHTNPNEAYVIIEPNAGARFTVYCKIERTFSDGTKKTRTAYYSNEYGNRCGTGTKGYLGRCDSGNSGGTGGWE